MPKFINVLFLLSPLFIFSQQQISFSQLSVEDGLSQNSVVSIAQDNTGYLWFATQDGLNKYNGKEFKYYPKLFQDITQETYSKLGKVYVDKENRIYIITKDGQLSTLKNNAVDAFVPIPRFTDASTLFQDSNHTTWVGSYGKGLYVFGKHQTDTIQVFKGKDAIRDIYAISEVDKKIIVATSNALFSVDPETLNYKEFAIKTEKEYIHYSSVATNGTHDIWVGTYGKGLFYKNANDELFNPFTGFSVGNQLPENLNIESLLYDSKNRLWIGTYGNGAFLVDFKIKTVTSFKPEDNNPKALHYNDVLSLHEDHTGNIWLGTDGAGLSFYDENLFKFNSLTNAQIPVFASIDVARAITVDAANNVWIGTSGKGLTLWKSELNSYQSYKHNPNDPKSIPSNRVMSLYSEDALLWIGFQDEGLSIFEEGTFTNFNHTSVPALPASTVWCIYKDSKNHYWLGTRDSGLLLFDKEKGVLQQFEHLPEDKTTLSGNNIRVILEGAPGELWVGTENSGLNKVLVKEGVTVRYDIPEAKNVKSLYTQGDTLWIGTNGNGLVAFNTKTEKTRTYTNADGLPNNVIYGILPDTQGNLWLSSNLGLCSFKIPSNTTESPEIVMYETYDGLQAREFNTGAYYKGNDGVLYFGGLKGINWFHPDALTKNSVAPKSVIYKLELFDEKIPIQKSSEFNFKENTLTFTFSGLHFSQPERNAYQYILEGYEENWSRPSTVNLARYTNIPSGHYVFKVLSSNYDGVWEAVPSTYSFTINPPWYLTLWAKIVYVLLFFTLLYLSYIYLKWRWRMQVKFQLKQQEAERLKNLNELKSKLYTNISHEFRTPLTLITGPVHQLLASSGLTKKNKKSLRHIENSSKRMLQLVNQLLDLSKIEAGTIRLHVGKNELKPQILQLIEAFLLPANEKGIEIKTTTDDFSETWYDRDVLEKIVSNLLSNAIKYSPENSEVHFSATEKHGYLMLLVENKNATLTENDLTKIFERFYQHDKTAEGVGIGLSLIKELVVLSNGTVSARKSEKNTILFQVQLPIKKDKYPPNTILKEPVQYDFISDPHPSTAIFNLDTSETSLILIVEDNKEVRKYIASLFEETCKVLEAADGLSGIQQAIETVPDIIISDIMMPKKDGIELCNTLKNDPRTSHIPILLLTAKSDDIHQLEGLKTKANDYITKPFNAEIVKQKVINQIENQKLLQKRYSQSVYLRPSEIAINDLDIVFFEDIQKLIDTKFTDSNYTATHFAKDLHMSRMQLHRKLKALTGLTTSEFLRSQRLKAAVQLLENSEYTVSEIAYSVGFNTPSYFIKCFRETYNTTPTAYVKR